MSKDLGVVWVQQGELYFCGPAVAQMGVACLGAPSPPQPPTWQERLWDEIQTETNDTRPPTAGPNSSGCPSFPEQKCEIYDNEWRCWSTTPDALQRVLDDGQSRAAYTVTTHDTENGATAELVKAVDNGVPGMALVYGWKHWVVVDGYVSNANGKTTYVCLRDPFSAKTSNVDEVSLHDWKHDYLSFVPAGSYVDKIVVIGGVMRAAAVSLPAPPRQVRVTGGGNAARDDAAAAPREDAARDDTAAAPREYGFALIPAEKAVGIANEAVKRLRERPKRWGLALSDAVAERSALLLERLDRHDDYDYIVTYHTGERVTARIRIDARTGRFAHAAGIDRVGASLTPYVDPAGALERFFGRSLDPQGVGARVVRRETVGRHPTLVWKPCRQSTSPFLPFYQFSLGDRLVYLRVDGVWFDRLTSGPA